MIGMQELSLDELDAVSGGDTAATAMQAVQGLSQRRLENRKLKVQYALEKEKNQIAMFQASIQGFSAMNQAAQGWASIGNQQMNSGAGGYDQA